MQRRRRGQADAAVPDVLLADAAVSAAPDALLALQGDRSRRLVPPLGSAAAAPAAPDNFKGAEAFEVAPSIWSFLVLEGRPEPLVPCHCDEGGHGGGGGRCGVPGAGGT